jgi:UDP-N-acetylmuramyl pentapeptide phosphotransferase/UDP-N-acetylglucosamine-1-phosphate transferase
MHERRVALEFFANVAQLWSYRFLQPVWSHWSSNLLLMTSIGNLTLLTLGKMNTMDMDNVNLVDDFNGLHSQVYLRSFFSLPMILAFRSDNIILSWIALLFVILGLYLPYPATALKRMKHVYLVEQSPID